LDQLRSQWREAVWKALARIDSTGCPPAQEDLVFETPPQPEMGDLAFPMFPFARTFKKSPKSIAEEVVDLLAQSDACPPGEIVAEGPYINIRYDRTWVSERVLSEVEKRRGSYGLSEMLIGRRIMVEFSCPNTNKPLHLGHLRNDSLGESISRILKAAGGEVLKVNLINDRGIHICKSMLAYRKLGGGKTPKDEKLKSDHFVGEYYVKYESWAKQDQKAEELVREMLRAWENGDPEVTSLWKRMNDWAVSGIEQTYQRTGISFDRIYFESDTYRLGREEVLRGLNHGVFYKKDDGSVWVDLDRQNLDHKVLLRADGTSLYVTQDIGTAIERYKDWPFNRLIYVVASEQNYHFKVLFAVLDLLGYPWARDLHHLAYGMVHLPEGKMKSREGTVVDADDLLDTLKSLAKAEIEEKGRTEELEDVEDTAEKIALGALNYYLLQPAPLKDMTFNPAESISFTGNTGPYLQYTGARLCSILRKFEERRQTLKGGEFRPELLTVREEWELVKLISLYPERLALAAEELNPSYVATHLYDLAKSCNKYYHDNPVLHNEDKNLVQTRIRVIRAVRRVLENGLYLLGVPFLERM
jgi:arginyl-tRNA synthetase